MQCLFLIHSSLSVDSRRHAFVYRPNSYRSQPPPSLIPRVTTLIDTVLLVIAGISLLPSIVLHLLAVVEVLAVSLDELVGFASCKASQDVFGHGVVFGDT